MPFRTSESPVQYSSVTLPCFLSFLRNSQQWAFGIEIEFHLTAGSYGKAPWYTDTLYTLMYCPRISIHQWNLQQSPHDVPINHSVSTRPCWHWAPAKPLEISKRAFLYLIIHYCRKQTFPYFSLREKFHSHMCLQSPCAQRKASLTNSFLCSVSFWHRL